MRRGSYTILLPVAALFALLQGCYTAQSTRALEKTVTQADARVDFSDPVLNQRQILLFGKIDKRFAEITIQKLLYLDRKSHDPIDLYLQTPGDEKQDSLTVEHIIRSLKSPVNTWAVSDCYSGGAILLAAGTGKRRAFHGAVIIVHGLTFRGNPPPEFTQPIQDWYTEFWRKRARLPEAWLPLPFDIRHILSAEQALEYGIIDEVVGK
jgi:ATP-dependent Clp protease, protease subunit